MTGVSQRGFVMARMLLRTSMPSMPESQIEEHGVGRAGCDDGEPLAARRGPRDGVRLAFERRADGLGNERIVFDKKDVHDGGRTREAPLSAFRKRKTGGLSPEEGPPA